MGFFFSGTLSWQRAVHSLANRYKWVAVVKESRLKCLTTSKPLRTQQEINDFLFCLRRNQHAERDVFLFLIGINSGLRMSDIVKLKKQDILTSKNPRIVEQKTGKTRILYLGSLQDLIQEYTKALDPADYLFPSSKGGI